MINELKNYLNCSYTAYHAVENAEKLLKDNGFTRLSETKKWDIKRGGKYYAVRNGSSLVAFTVGDGDYFKIAASHTDSPALKLKASPIIKGNGYARLNVEKYGGGILYSFLDRPLVIAGRINVRQGEKIVSENTVSDYNVVIPSQAIHINRSVNDGMQFNAQTDLSPLISFEADADEAMIYKTSLEGEVVGADLYLVSSEKCYDFGAKGDFVAAPRIDNLSSVFASLNAIINTKDTDGISVAAFFNSEEIGNGTSTGAEGDLVEAALLRIASSLGMDTQEYYAALARSVLLSIDVAHAVHPNHPEKSDPTNRPILGGGVVIKRNANGAYATDGMAEAIIGSIFTKNGIPTQSYHARSDMPCGTTLGKNFVCKMGMLACDIGLPQLAMHSACESFAAKDYTYLYDAVSAFYGAKIRITDDETEIK